MYVGVKVHLGSLEKTHIATIAFGCTSRNSYASFVLSLLLMNDDARINCYVKLHVTFTQNEIRASVYRKRRQLKQAFDVLKVWCNEKWVITKSRWLILMNEVCPNWSPARVALLWQVLDDDSDGKIGITDCFIFASDYMNNHIFELRRRRD